LTCALADIRFRPKAVVSQSVQFGFGGLQLVNSVVAESRSQSLSCGRPECTGRGEPLASLCTDYTEEVAALSASASGTVGPCGSVINDTRHTLHG